MTEILILKCFLFIAFLLAPQMTRHFFLKQSKAYAVAHNISLLILFCGAFFDFNYAVLIWPLFCAFGFLLYLRHEGKFIFSSIGLASCIPFVFSLISATWLVAGVLDLHLLGYSVAWSFYAALHGSFLGWFFVGCLAHLAQRSKLYLAGSYMSLPLFLCVAFGIDGVPHIKRIGLIGFTLLVPLTIGYYAFQLKKGSGLSKSLALVSLGAIIVSMGLAVGNEFGLSFPRMISNIPTMVLIHGFLNAILTVPCFFLAIRFEKGKQI